MQHSTPSPRSWRAGVGTIDITPAAGSPMACFPLAPGQPRLAQGIRDRLLARTLVLGNGEDVIALCTADICMIHAVDVARVRERVVAQLPRLAGARIIIAASHTHSSLENSYLFGGKPSDEAIERLNQQLGDSILAAWKDRESVRITMGRTSIDLNHNRRVRQADGSFGMVYDRQPGVTDGPTDPELCIWCLQRPDGTDKALLFHYTAHALALGPANRHFSADWPGVVRDCIEAARPETQVLFVNGAAGNIHPSRSMCADDSAAVHIGERLAEAVIDALPELRPPANTTLALCTRTLTVANRVDPDRTVSIEVQRLQIGEWQIGIVPGELFVEAQLAFKAQLAPAPAMLIGYANGWPGYLPVRQAFSEGGYGVELCATDAPDVSRTAAPPGTAEQILELLLEPVAHPQA